HAGRLGSARARAPRNGRASLTPEGRLRSRAGRAGRWALVAVVLTFAWIGLLHLTRGTAVKHVTGVAPGSRPVAVDEPAFPVAVTMLTGTWLMPGHRVEVMLNGDGTYERLWADLRSAQRTITLQIYYGSPGDMARTLGEILRERVAAGVQVRLLYDAFGTSGMPGPQLDALR